VKSIEVSARTIEEAISEGLNKLHCTLSDCKVEILHEGAKGLFGFFGSKPAAVRLTLLSEAEEEDDLKIGLTLAAQETPRAKARTASRAEKPQSARAEKPAAKAAPASSSVAPAVPEKKSASRAKGNDVLERFKSAPLPNARGESASPVKKASPKIPRAPREAYDDDEPHAEPHTYAPVAPPENIVLHDADAPEGRAQQFLLALTQRMGVDVLVDVRMAEPGQMMATLYGDTLGILIGRRGETLDALQYLTSLQVNHGQSDYTRVTLDTENYRAKREEALTRLASRMANRAVKTGRKVSLEPMNPYERRILHASLQGNPHVSTHSEGDEPYRHVVVVPER